MKSIRSVLSAALLLASPTLAKKHNEEFSSTSGSTTASSVSSGSAVDNSGASFNSFPAQAALANFLNQIGAASSNEAVILASSVDENAESIFEAAPPSGELKLYNNKKNNISNAYLKKYNAYNNYFKGHESYTVDDNDDDFMKTLREFHNSLLRGARQIAPDLRPQRNEPVYRADKLVAKWHSVDCSLLSFSLKVVGTIHAGRRNKVLKFKDRNTNKMYAYKTFDNPDEFYAELELFLWVDHPYFVKAVCHRKDFESGHAGIMFEYIEGRSSYDYARGASPKDLQRISAELFLALEHLHYLGVVHADLKPENVMIDKDGTVKLIDFGFAIHLPYGKRRRGTHTTMAPELHYKVPGKVHEAVDWWAYGSTIAMWYAAASSDGRRFIPMDWVEDHFVAGQVPNSFSNNFRDFLYMFFQANPEARRFNTRRLLKVIRNHAFFQGLDWGSLYGGRLTSLGGNGATTTSPASIAKNKDPAQAKKKQAREQ